MSFSSHRFSFRLLAIVWGSWLTLTSLGVAHDDGRHPNVLLILTDDHRADTISAWGNPIIQTPNLDDLARRGVSFRGNYCFGSWHGAVCVPSRAMLMSGRHLFDVDEELTSAVTLPELLGQHGYTTFIAGKWHNGAESARRSFQSGRSIFFGGMSDHNQLPVRDLRPDGSYTNVAIAPKHSSETIADSAIEFLQADHGENPFFCYVAFTAPHDPRDPPIKYRQMYYDRRPPLPRNFLPQHPFDNGQLVLRDEVLAPWPRPESVIADQLAEYYGLITHMDEQLGRILAALARGPHARDTIIVFAADQGVALGSHGLLGKQSLYEHSMRSPMIIAGPGIPRNKSTHKFTYLYDLFPTICDLVHVPPPARLAGSSLRPLWESPDGELRESVFLAYAKWMRAVRDERWKLIRYPQINHVQLFDLQNDPDEITDLASAPEQTERIGQLTQLMREWQAKVGDQQALEVENPEPKLRDLTGTPRVPDPWQPTWIVEKYFQDQPR